MAAIDIIKKQQEERDLFTPATFPTPQEHVAETRAATLTQLAHPVGVAAEYVSRPGYAVANIYRDASMHPQQMSSFFPLFQRDEQGRPMWQVLWEAARQGLTGERKGSFRDTALDLGIPDTPIIPAFRNIPILGSTWAGAFGLGGDLSTDLTNLVGIGVLNRAGRLAQRTNQLRGLRSAQALAGQRDLLTIGGRGLSSLPGRAGEAARQAQSAVYRAFELPFERLASTESGEAIINAVTSRGTGAVAVVRERLRQREAEEAFQTRQAARQYGQQRREIIDIANRYRLDPEELERSITFEAERRVRSAPVEASERVVGGADSAALPGESFRASDLTASFVEAPTTKYTVAPGDTLSEIAERFGTTADALAANNNIRDPNRIRAGQTIDVPMPQEAQEILSSIREAQPERLARERSVGIHTPEFESDRIAYLHRERTEEFRNLPRRQRREVSSWLNSNRPILSLQHGAQRGRTIAPDAYIREVNQAAVEGRTKAVWLDAEGNIVPEGTRGAQKQYVITDERQAKPDLPRVPLFSEDPSVIELARERMSIRTVTTAEAIDDIIRLGTNEGWAVRADSGEAAHNLLSAGWKTIQAPRFQGKFENVYFPSSVAKEIDKFMELFSSKAKNPIPEYIKGALRWWRDQTLFAFPEYYMRNLGTGVVKNYYAGLNPTNAKAYARGNLFAIYRQADRVAPRSGRAENLARRIEEMGAAKIRTKDGKEYSLQQILDWYESERLGQGYFEGQFQVGDALTASEALRGRGFDVRRLNPLSSDNYAIGAGKAFGTYIEDNLRGALFIQKLVEGLPPHEAANVVREYHFDYSDIPEWMKRSREYATPFITWAVKNVPNEIATLIQQPGKAARIMDVVRAEEARAEGPDPTPEEVPNFLLMPIYTGRDEQGKAKFSNLLSMWGLLDVADLLVAPVDFVLKQLHGFILEGFEQWQNRDFDLKRPINPEELERVGDYGMEGPFNLHPRLDHVLQLYRPYNMLRRFYDPSTTIGQDLLRTATSYHTYTSNPYFAGPVHFRNFEEAAQYYQGQVIRYGRLAQEAEARGDTRAALRYQQMAQDWLNQARERLPQLRENLPQMR